MSEVTPVEEIVYEYQPVDEVGRPIGGKQVFKGATEREVLDKVAKANQEVIKLNRELSRRLRIGQLDQDTLPENVAKFDEVDEIKPIELTAEERVQIARDMLDPEKMVDAANRLIRSQVGEPEKIRQSLSRVNRSVSAVEAKEEAELFVKANPSYYVCKENFETIVNWMIRYNLSPIKVNYQLAFDTLKAAGLLLEAPIVREEFAVVTPVTETVETPANTQPVVDETSRITSQEATANKRHTKVASGLTNTITSSVGQSQSKKLSIVDIERMSGDEYKRRLVTDPNFSKEVDEAYAAVSQSNRI